MLVNCNNGNPSYYEGKLIKSNHQMKIIIEELLKVINQNGIDLDEEIEELLIKIEIH